MILLGMNPSASSLRASRPVGPEAELGAPACRQGDASVAFLRDGELLWAGDGKKNLLSFEETFDRRVVAVEGKIIIFANFLHDNPCA